MATFVQGTGIVASGSVTSVSKAFASNVTAGNCICVGCHSDSGKGGTNASVWSSSPANTFTHGVTDAGGHCNNSYVLNCASGATTITFTPTSSDYCAIAIGEFSGIATSAAGDGSNSNTNNTANPAAGNITTTTSGLVWGTMGRHATGTITPGAGFSEIFEEENWNNTTISTIYQITPAGTYNANWTAGGGVAWWASAFALKDAAGGGATTFTKITGERFGLAGGRGLA